MKAPALLAVAAVVSGCSFIKMSPNNKGAEQKSTLAVGVNQASGLALHLTLMDQLGQQLSFLSMI